MTDSNSLRKEAYPTWPVSVANWRPQISVQPNQLNMQIGYKAAAADRLQPNPTVDSNDVEINIGGDLNHWNGKYPDVAGLPGPQLYQSVTIKDLNLPESFLTIWNKDIRNLITQAVKEAPGYTNSYGRDIKRVLDQISAKYLGELYPTEVEVQLQTLGGCLPPISEQSSFIGSLPDVFETLLANTFVQERDEEGNVLDENAQRRLQYNQRLNLRQEWISTATFQRNTAGSIYNRGPAIQGVQVQYPIISTQMNASYLEPFSKISVPGALKTGPFAPSHRKFTNETGQSTIIPGQSFAAITSTDEVPALAIKNLPRCIQNFSSPSFAKNNLVDLQRTRPEIFGARTNRSNKFFSVQPRSANALYANFQRSNIGKSQFRPYRKSDQEAARLNAAAIDAAIAAEESARAAQAAAAAASVADGGGFPIRV